MPKKKTIDNLIKTPGQIKGGLKRKGVRHLTNPEGTNVPIDVIKDRLLITDNFVRQIAELWVEIFSSIRHLKKLLLDGGPEMYKYLNSKHAVRRDSKGGFTEYDFSKNIKVVVSYDLRYDFDDNLMKQSSEFMETYLASKDDDDLVSVIRAAFKQNNGRYDIKALNRLKELQVDNEDFKKAVELSQEAVSSTPTKLRTQLFIRDSEGEFKSVPLSISDVAKEGIDDLSFEYLSQQTIPKKSGE